eukprot:6213929-Pleurochrysis_carterae.AAC.2
MLKVKYTQVSASIYCEAQVQQQFMAQNSRSRSKICGNTRPLLQYSIILHVVVTASNRRGGARPTMIMRLK